MNVIFNYILDLINSFFPIELNESFSKFNEILAYGLTISLIFIIVRFFYNFIRIKKN